MSTSLSPTRRDYELPLLKAIADLGGSVAVPNTDLEARVASLMGWSDEAWDSVHARPKWVYELQWVRYNLVRSGDLERSPRGVWRISEQGMNRVREEWRGPASYQSPPLAPPSNDDVFYELRFEDIQTAAQEELGRSLTREELLRVADRVPAFIEWHDIICTILRDAIHAPDAR